MRRLFSTGPAVALAVVACVSAAPPADSAGGAGAEPVQSTPSPAGAPTHPVTGKALEDRPEDRASLVARLDGAQPVRGPRGEDVGDRDGRATALVKIRDNRITFAFSWEGVSTPTLAHIHRGAPGTNGEPAVGLFTSPMPEGVHSAAGQTTLIDADLAEELRTSPREFYVSLQNAEFPGGALRAQLEPLAERVNPLSFVKGGQLRGHASGGQAVPIGDVRAVGDPDGHAVTFLHPGRASLGYSMAWVNLAPPSSAHVHRGALGRNGPAAVPLFTSPVPRNVFALSGEVQAKDAGLLRGLSSGASGFYANVRTQEFPDGAVRGQLFR
ncbi:CHRD domain-containing protein [Streptomyces sp. NPDC014894]|uniref:CHRD domain-containing protein n=1 Tax=Streptomyces sp. NPDC014894 TaxID=3364931 RepID=UPI0036FC4F8D